MSAVKKAILLGAVSALLFCTSYPKNDGRGGPRIVEQALFSGFYPQGYAHGNGSPISLGCGAEDMVRFDIGTRAFEVLDGDMSSDDYVYRSRLYSEDHRGYEFAGCDDGIYYGDGGALKSAGDIGPKFGPISSTCKIRAYYYDVPSPFGLQAVMYDFTGFLVGDSLLMTAAHGLCLDVTSGIFDDGVENYYMPGKVEVYGAIGLADEWHGGYRYYSECGEIYMDSEYLGNRAINRDWALLRLDRPLGRELSYRVLAPEASAFESLSVVGYPSWNQLCERKIATNGSILSSYGQFCYSTDTSEGVCRSRLGSPLKLTPSTIADEIRLHLKAKYGCEMDPIGKYDACSHGGYRIALVCDPFNYYHALRQNQDGNWSHFLMNSGVSGVDFNGDPILDPEVSFFANYSSQRLNATQYINENTYILIPVFEPAFNITSFVGFFEVYIEV